MRDGEWMKNIDLLLNGWRMDEEYLLIIEWMENGWRILTYYWMDGEWIENEEWMIIVWFIVMIIECTRSLLSEYSTMAQLDVQRLLNEVSWIIDWSLTVYYSKTIEFSPLDDHSLLLIIRWLFTAYSPLCDHSLPFIIKWWFTTIHY